VNRDIVPNRVAITVETAKKILADWPRTTTYAEMGWNPHDLATAITRAEARPFLTCCMCGRRTQDAETLDNDIWCEYCLHDDATPFDTANY
jgi:hypothetical protein